MSKDNPITPVLEAFIKKVNADHDDIISIPRNHACVMRDEIQTLKDRIRDAVTVG